MAGKRKLGIDEVIRIARLSSPRVSSRGDIAYSLSIPDAESNKYRHEIRVMFSGGGEAYYQGEGDSLPAWSPEGDRLAFASRRGASKSEKGSGLFVVGVGGEPRRVSWFKHGVSRLGWIDGSTVFLLTPSEDEKYYDKDGDYYMTDRLPFWFDGAGPVAGLSDQLYLVDVDSGRSRQVTREPLGVLDAEPCNGYMYIVSLRSWKDPLDTILKRVNLESGEAETVLEGITISSIRCIDSKLYMLAHRREIGIASHEKLYILDGEGEAECLTCKTLDRNIWSIAGSLSGKPVILYADSGRSVLAIYDGGVSDLVREDMVIASSDSNGSKIAYIASAPDSPPELYVYDEGGQKRVSRVNEWVSREFKLYRPSHLKFESHGDEIEGWVIDPDDSKFEKKPLILFIHGGPKGMYGYSFHYEMQLFASKGFVVAFANPRGSDGYGEEFADIRGRYGDVDYNQLMDFLDRVVERYNVDENKMVVTGISYGGYMTNVAVTKTRRFAAAVSENGIADWIADFWAADIGYWFDIDQIGGTPLDNLEEYVRRSPAFHADRVETPLLIIHSMEDYRCFIDQALAMHTALKMLGKDSTLLVFSRGSHGHSVLAPPRHRKKRLEIKLKWIYEKLGLKME